LGFSNFHL